MKRSQFPKGRMSIVILLLIAAAAAVVTLGCPHTTPDPPKPPIDDPEDGFSWTSPNTPKESIFSVAKLGPDTGSRAVTVTVDGEGALIEPDSFKAAYSFLALVPQSKVQNISDQGLQACWTDSDWLRNDGDGVRLDDNSLIPGFWERRDALPYNLFEAYLDDSTPITRDEVKAVSFPLYDSTERAER